MTGVSRRFDQPDATRDFPQAHWDVVQVGDRRVARITFQPGWRWSECIKPTSGTESCLVPHTNYIVSGHLATRMDDGTEFVSGPGEVTWVPPGHDGWVVGDEPVVMIDFTGSNPGIAQ